MRTHLLILFVFLNSTNLFAQDTAKSITKKNYFKVSEKSIVKDSLGNVILFSDWRRLAASGEYGLKPLVLGDEDSPLVLFKFSEEQLKKIEQEKQNLPKPRESNFFETGKKFSKIKTRDLFGEKINTKDYKGKILVLNFWFTTCGPCIMEMPSLNKLVDKYGQDSSVIFLSVALNDAITIKTFLKTNPFKYIIIDNGSFLTNAMRITSYPTNVVIDKKGKIYFHTSGLFPNTVDWIEKSILELKDKQ
jgi:thiol-disulfide isomerase/thioredoxin